MTKLMVIKDPHFRRGFSKPIGRVEGFDSQISSKIKFVRGLGREKGCDTLLIAGDVLDKKAPSMYSFNSVKNVEDQINELKEQFTNLITIAGNHDFPYSSVELKPLSVYQYLVNHSVIRDVTTDPLITSDGVEIHGIDYQNPEKNVFNELDKLHNSLSNDKLNIVMLHQHFTPFNDRLDFVDFFKYEDLIKYDKVGVFIMGHLHKGYPLSHTELKNGKKQYYINQWSFVRLAREYYAVNDKHIPEVVYIECNNSEVSIETIPIPVVEAKKVFIESEIEIKSNVDLNINEFIDKLTKSDHLQDEDEHFFPNDIKEKILFYLDKTGIN